jgi:hypothetical protein
MPVYAFQSDRVAVVDNAGSWICPAYLLAQTSRLSHFRGAERNDVESNPQKDRYRPRLSESRRQTSLTACCAQRVHVVVVVEGLRPLVSDATWETAPAVLITVRLLAMRGLMNRGLPNE